MLTELAVRDLGVIADLSLVLGPGLTAVTGETGAGKTLIVEAIELVVGGRADPVLVRPGAAEARVDGRFVHDADIGAPDGPDEVVLGRVVPASGRSRAYVDGRPAPVSALAQHGARLVDLHGQHAHQSLLATAAQRAALDAFAGIDLTAMLDARRRVAAIDCELATLGGDARARAREIDLLRYQVGEVDAARIEDADEDDRLRREEALLADAGGHRVAAAAVHDALTADGGAADALGAAVAAVANRPALAAVEARLRALAAEVADVAADARAAGEAVDDDPERLAAIGARRQLLTDLRRKYGDTLADVVAFADEARARLVELESWDDRAAALEGARAAALADLAAAESAVGAARRAAAPELAVAVGAHLGDLAMAGASVVVEVDGDGPGDDVRILLAANAGEPALPLAKVASGGELARAMLALRLVLTRGPETLVFDEVDAGIGGAAAIAVGRSLAALARDHQVLVVTHLPQVAAWADQHVAVAKHEVDGRTVATARLVEGADRVAELSRMLAGRADSTSARDHALELLAAAASERTRP